MSWNMSRAGMACVCYLLVCGDASAQGFYPGDWWQGRSGLFSRDYLSTAEDLPGYVTGGPASTRSSHHGKLIFAAATVDQRCQQNGSPRVSVLASPRAGRIAVDIGRFVATGIDGGSTICLRQSVRGTRVFYVGRPLRGDRIVLRVAYPTKGLTYDHVITVP